MNKHILRSSFAALAIVLTACRGAQSPLASVPLPKESHKVVFISFDGAGTDDVHQFLRDGTLGTNGYAALERDGTYADRLVPVTPSSTAAAHISMITGASPQTTGIVANYIKLPHSPINVSTSGFSASIDAETLWESARRQGKKVGILSYPGIDFTNPRRSADWGIVYTKSVSKSELLVLHRRDFEGEWYPPGWNPPQSEAGSYSPILRAHVHWALATDGRDEGKDIELRAIDTTNDGVTNYDRIDVVDDGNLVRRDAKGWFAISTPVTRSDGDWLFGSWSKIIRFDPSLDDVTIYWGGVNRTVAYPADYRKLLDSTLGFWPGEPDHSSVGGWLRDGRGIDPASFSEQNDRFSTFLTEAAVLSLTKMPYDLVIGYQPAIDSAEHPFRLVNDRQKLATPQNRAVAREVRADAYRNFDQAIARLRSILPNDAILVAAGDHGVAACDTSIGIGTLLVQWGFAKPNGNSFAADSKWSVFGSGNVVSFYRAAGVSDRELLSLDEKLKSLRAPDGSPVVERVVRRDSSSHPNTGDLTAFAFPRFEWSDTPGAAAAVASEDAGEHGGLSEHPEFHTIFAAAGPGVPHRDVGVVRQTSVARFLARLLGIQPPAAAER